jgi:chemotaxis protein methyltransferase WspC
MNFKTSQISVQAIASRLRAAMGIDPSGLDGNRLLWIVEARCRELKLPHPSAYVAYLEETPTEIDALIEEAVVRETRFFRDPAVFDAIRRTLAHLAASTTGHLRILSAPCGTGEEAYSIAAQLHLLSVVPARFTIDAFDISSSSLDTARAGIYPERALSQVPQDMQMACAQRTGNEWQVHSALRERVNFERRNLANPGSLGDAAQYHLILCRNLFIYLAPEARAALAQSLSTALLPGGRLFLGTADRVPELTALFTPLRPAASFEFSHRSPASAVADPHPRALVTARMAPPSVRNRKPTLAQLPHPHTAPSAEIDAAALPAANELLQRALEHRQLGEVAKAERRCRQALYLAPNLLPALELLLSLWSEHPNLRQRRALRDRVLRNRLLLRPAAIETGHEENA